MRKLNCGHLCQSGKLQNFLNNVLSRSILDAKYDLDLQGQNRISAMPTLEDC